jgi:hypothetical protein
MTEAPTPSRGHNRMTLLLIVAMFVGPILVAHLLVIGALDWRGQGIVNRGTLLSPPLDLRGLGSFSSLQKLNELAPSEWAIVLIEPTSCEQQCIETLDKMLTLRELLGQGAVRTSVHAITVNAPTPGHHANRIHLDPAGSAALGTALSARVPNLAFPLLTLVDWRRQLMMYYPIDVPPQDLQKDLKRLLRASEIR